MAGPKKKSTKIAQLLVDRKTTHGDFTEVSKIYEHLLSAVENTSNWYKLPAQRRMALREMFHKIARIMCGDHSYQDHYDDIAGYAERLREIVPSSDRGK